MRYVFRAMLVMAVLGFMFNLSLAQKAVSELPDGADRDLDKTGTREAHQGADNPMQGNRSTRQGPLGGPDPYGPEDFQQFMDKAERQLNDPQWQLKIDLQDPKRIVVNHPDGTSREYWYVMFRVINDNTRTIKSTELPGIDTNPVDLDNPPSPRVVTDNSSGDIEGVPVDCHLDFQFNVYTRDIEKNPWDTAPATSPDDEVLTPEQLAARRAAMKHTYRPVSDQFVLQKVAEKEGMYEWKGNYNFINEPVMLLHPLSDFQRQIGFSRELTAPDLGGLRCLPYRVTTFQGGARSDADRYVAVYNSDNTFAGVFGPDDPLPDGARLVKSPDDEMWGKLTQRRYVAGDCIDRYGRPLRVNDPGYLNARAAGSKDGKSGSYGVLAEDNPAVGQPVRVPHYRLYQEGDHVLFGYDTGIKRPDIPNENYKINGQIVGPSEPLYDQGQSIDNSTEQFGGSVVGRPVKVIDNKGRAVRRYVVTYQAGEMISEAAWNIWKARLGPGILSRYSDIDSITSRALKPDDPVIGLPKIKMGYFVSHDGNDDHKDPETIKRLVDDAAEPVDYATGRRYDPRKIGPNDFQRDPDGEFTTNREAPVPPGTTLTDGEKYVYAPLGKAGADAVPVPAFDQYGVWKDYHEELSGSRIPLTDADGKLVHDAQDQLLYMKDYEYEYVYMYQYAETPLGDSGEYQGYQGAYGGDHYELKKETIRVAKTKQTVRKMGDDGKVTTTEVEVVLPLNRLIWKTEKVNDPKIVNGYQAMNELGQSSDITEDQYKMINEALGGEHPKTVYQVGNGADASYSTDKPSGDALRVLNVTMTKVVKAEEVERKVVVGVFNGDESTLKEGEHGETWEEAEARAKAEGATVDSNVEVISYVNRYRNEKVSGVNDHPGGPREDEFNETEKKTNNMDLSKTHRTWSRWTVPPPMVYVDNDGNWHVLTHLADKVGPGSRWDDSDARRFLTRYISEMWGVAIFEGVTRDWDYANVYVKGLRGLVSNAGLEADTSVTSMPSPADGETKITKAFFNPRYVTEDWTYRVRYERLGDEFENYRDLIRRVRSFWYREESDTGG